ncbi:hypothetical protein [Actinoplanes sp. M2I2]|uniref:hypothetical protein n=1 Tax=Actinoplanes sp. M2I2 TaxID=1734444 RepID=UPI0020220B68|nr:hypothetical protein [Actinoplanes sp. M2I2]
MSERIPVYFGFRDYLWDVLPESREHILSEELSEVESSGDTRVLTAYRFMSNAFFRPVLLAAAESGDIELARRCIALVEDMLAGRDADLVDLVRIRVLSKTGESAALGDLYRAYAGPLTREELAVSHADPTYLPPGDPNGSPAWVGDGRPDAAAWAVRSWLWERVPGTRSHVLIAERAEVRATMSLVAMTPGRYLSEAFLRGLLPEAGEAAAELGDPEPSEESAAAVEAMLADPLMAALLRPHLGEVVAEAARNPLLRAHAGPGLGSLLS